MMLIIWGTTALLWFTVEGGYYGATALCLGQFFAIYYVTSIISNSTSKFWASFDLLPQDQIDDLRNKALAYQSEEHEDTFEYRELQKKQNDELKQLPLSERENLENVLTYTNGLVSFWETEHKDEISALLKKSKEKGTSSSQVVEYEERIRAAVSRRNLRIAYFQLLVILRASEKSFIVRSQLKRFLTERHQDKYSKTLYEFQDWLTSNTGLPVELEDFFKQDQEIIDEATKKFEIMDHKYRTKKVKKNLYVGGTTQMDTHLFKTSVESAVCTDVTGWNYKKRQIRTGLQNLNITGEKAKDVMRQAEIILDEMVATFNHTRTTGFFNCFFDDCFPVISNIDHVNTTEPLFTVFIITLYNPLITLSNTYAHNLKPLC